MAFWFCCDLWDDLFRHPCLDKRFPAVADSISDCSLCAGLVFAPVCSGLRNPVLYEALLVIIRADRAKLYWLNDLLRSGGSGTFPRVLASIGTKGFEDLVGHLDIAKV